MMKTSRQKGKAEREAAQKHREQKERERINRRAGELLRRAIGETTLSVDRNHLRPDTDSTTQRRLRRSKVEGTKRQESWWHSRTARGIAVIVSVVFSLFGGSLAWEFVSADPVVELPVVVDSGDPLRAPFHIFNDLGFYTYYDVHPSCIFDEKSSAFMNNIELDRGEREIGSIPRGQRIPYLCPVEGTPLIPGISIIIRVEYAMRPLPFVYVKSVREVPFTLKINSSGDPYWVEGNYLWKKVPETRN